METEPTEMDSGTDNLAVSEEANVDLSIPIHLRKEKSTEAYKETMNQYIETIEKYENRRLVNIKNGDQYMRL